MYTWPDAPAAEQVYVILTFIVLAELVGAIGAGASQFVTRSGRRGGCGGRSARRIRPRAPYTPYDSPLWRIAPWQPPGWVFFVAWTFILYPLIGLAAAVTFLHGDYTDAYWISALAFWFAQLLFNGLWTPIFFGAFNPRAAFGIILVTLVLTIVDIVLLWFVDTLAFAFMIVYAAWLLFATTLNGYTAFAKDYEQLARVIDEFKGVRAEMNKKEDAEAVFARQGASSAAADDAVLLPGIENVDKRSFMPTSRPFV